MAQPEKGKEPTGKSVEPLTAHHQRNHPTDTAATAPNYTSLAFFFRRSLRQQPSQQRKKKHCVGLCCSTRRSQLVARS
jgi:hypothetical protein